jgi:3,4-dihydroxy 2-butanone 4-phosphate synthase/GTP cyclohydrolase II
LVTLSYAQSLDGSLTLQRGRPLSLSSAQSLRLTHRLRALHDAILVGVGTVLADNPRLTVRLVRGRQPHAVVLDSHLRLPLTSALFENRHRSLWIACVERSDHPRWQALQARGALLLSFPPDRQGRVRWEDLLPALYERGICSLMVEGGAEVIHSLLESALADQAVITLAPRFVGGLSVLEKPLAVGGKAQFPTLASFGYQRFGEDLVVWGKLTYPQSPSLDPPRAHPSSASRSGVG